MDIGERIKYFRKEKHLSQERLAWMAEITPAYLGQIERGCKSPTVTVLSRISSALDIPLHELFFIGTDTSRDKADVLIRIQIQLIRFPVEDLKRIYEIIGNISEIKEYGYG